VVALVVVAVVVALVLGAAVGLGGQVARWCPVHGEPMVCTVCRPYPAVARAAVRWQAHPAGTSARPLMTRAAQNRTSRINQRRSI